MIYGNSINEVLTEGSVYKSSDYSIGIFGSGLTDRGYIHSPYIKISRGNIKTNEYLRINLVDMKYENHGRKVNPLTKEEARKINKIMVGLATDKSGKTVWEAILSEFEKQKVDKDIMDRFYAMETPPDFTKIKK